MASLQMPATQREQLLFAVAFISLIGAGAYWYFVDSPKRAEFVGIEAHLDTLDASNQRARAQLARGSVASIRAEADSLRRNLELMRTLVPASNEVPALIDQVSNAARRVRLEIANIGPQPPIEGEMFDTHRYRLQINGSFHEIAQALAYIASLNRVVAPINLNLATATAPAGKAVEGRQYLTATFDIQTYVVRTAPPKAGGQQ